MKITFEFNDNEIHLVKWCFCKCAELLGTFGDNEIEHQHKRVLSNIINIGEFASELLTKTKEGDNKRKTTG